MKRYYFDLVDTTETADITGAILDDDEHAKKLAQDLAREVREGRRDLVGQGYRVAVRDESGDEIARVPVDPGSADGKDR